MADTPVITGGDGFCYDSLFASACAEELKYHQRLMRASHGFMRLIGGMDVFNDIDRLHDEYFRRVSNADEAIWFKDRFITVLSAIGIFDDGIATRIEKNIVATGTQYAGITSFEIDHEEMECALPGVSFLVDRDGEEQLLTVPVDSSTKFISSSTN